jgi:hypothetical protein
MGTCYTYLLHDEWDWHSYGGGLASKDRSIAELKKEFPVAEILAQWPHYIVVDLDKNSPYGENIQRLQKYCENAWYYGDTSTYELKELKFKQLPEDKIAEANKPKNRNAKYIKEANDAWTSNYNNRT